MKQLIEEWRRKADALVDDDWATDIYLRDLCQ